MRDLRCLTFSLLLCFFSGCGSDSEPPSPPHADIAKAQMIGMSKSEVFTCLGQPAKTADANNAVTWTYTYGSCTVNLTLVDGKVKVAAYSAHTGGDQTEVEQCESMPEVVSCTRWLRH